MGKKAKEHRKKVAKRNESIKAQQNKLTKFKEDIMHRMIEQEKLEGKFENNQSIPGVNGPLLDLGVNGPQI